ncbi:MAG: hypothetical protein KF767_01490 [Bdellovibrionaceae bacterium]|nr:hypothetical protein [Pseudobdellovibrionaceae bacterium]
MKAFVLIPVLLLLAGCNYSRMKNENRPNLGAQNMRSMGPLDFQTIQANILGPRCYGCHLPETGNKGNSNLATYNDVRAQLGRVAFRSLESKDMPPAHPLSADEMALLTAWMDAGAPEIAMGIPDGGDRALDQGPTDFRKISQGVFAGKCLSCHQPKYNGDGDGAVAVRAAADLDLTDFAQVKAAATKIFDRVIVKQDMPVQPLPGLSPKERRVILKWFELGMPQ